MIRFEETIGIFYWTREKWDRSTWLVAFATVCEWVKVAETYIFFYIFLIIISIILLLVTCQEERVKWENWRVRNGEPWQQGRSWPPNLTLVFSKAIFVPSSLTRVLRTLVAPFSSSLFTRTCAYPFRWKGWERAVFSHFVGL